ncbi:MAG TPA: endonuclease domain-containing protein [Methylomirabilota bacterium]|nr:endonuclease domain-containing protein [Methylomirabilota bacterium]
MSHAMATYTPSPLWGEGTLSTLSPPWREGALSTSSPLWGEGRGRGCVRESPRDYARGLRRRQTDAERRLWARLRDRRLRGVKFARQVHIGLYVVDFCCREQRLIVEVDGGQHAMRVAHDAARTAFLEGLGYLVLRFWDNDVLGNTDGVLVRITEALATRPSPRPSPRRGEGEGQGDGRVRKLR